MASEDSDQVGSGLVAVHGLHDLDEIEQTGAGEMMAISHRPHAEREAMEVAALCGTQRMRLEERDDPLEELLPPAHHVLVQVIAVVVVSPVDVDAPDPEELVEILETAGTPRSLRYDELVHDLQTGSVAASSGPVWLADEANGEASLSVYETQNPAKRDQPFLLVVCTDRIVTAHDCKSRTSTGRILRFSSI